MTCCRACLRMRCGACLCTTSCRMPTPPANTADSLPTHCCIAFQMANIAPSDASGRPDGQQPATTGEAAGLGGLHINDSHSAPELQAPPLGPSHGWNGAAPPPQHSSDSTPADSRPWPHESHPSAPAAQSPSEPQLPPRSEQGGPHQTSYQQPPPPSGFTTLLAMHYKTMLQLVLVPSHKH
jgi:hypothetical protein